MPSFGMLGKVQPVHARMVPVALRSTGECSRRDDIHERLIKGFIALPSDVSADIARTGRRALFRPRSTMLSSVRPRLELRFKMTRPGLTHYKKSQAGIGPHILQGSPTPDLAKDGGEP